MADLSLDLNGPGYIDRLETKIESPKAEVVTPNSEKSFSLKTVPDEGSSVDGELGNTKENDDNEMKDECWIDRCETKITTNGHLICSKTGVNNKSVENCEDNLNSIKNNVTDCKKSKKTGCYEITSATSFFISESKKSKDSHELISSNLSPVKIKEKEVSMLYQMGVEAVGKPIEPKVHEEYPLQQTDQADSHMEAVAMATQESRREAAKAGWASIRQESGEVENYLMEEDDDENVIIHLGSEFSTDTGKDEKTESIATIDNMQKPESVQVLSANISISGGVRLAQEEDTTLLEGSIAKNKLSKLESALNSIGEEDSVRSQREKSVEKPEYKTQVSAESRNTESQNFAQEDKTCIAQGQNDSTLTKPDLQSSSQVLGQQNMKMVVGERVSSNSQEQLTDEKMKSEIAMEKLNKDQSSTANMDSSQQIRSLNENVSSSLGAVPNPNQIEVERKFRISQDCRQKLKDIGAKMVKEKQFTDEYFDDIKYKLTLSNSWLRKRNNKWEFKIPIRHTGQGDDITSEYEIVKHLSKLYGVKSSVENVSVEDVTKELGIEIFATFTTTRQTYHLPNCTVDLDLADFGFEVGMIEVVVSDKSRITEALDIIDDVAKELGVKCNSAVYGDA